MGRGIRRQVVTRGEDFAWAYEKSLTSRREKGCFYSPESLVQFLVERTVGSSLAGCTAEQALALRVVDPSCGGGLFLLEVGRRIERHLRGLGVPLDGGLRKRIAEKCLIGIDVDA